MSVTDVFLATLLKQTFCTVIWHDGRWVYGAEVKAISDGHGGVVLRTVKNGVLVDNLDELPIF
jgi:hypothetical protein